MVKFPHRMQILLKDALLTQLETHYVGSEAQKEEVQSFSIGKSHIKEILAHDAVR